MVIVDEPPLIQGKNYIILIIIILSLLLHPSVAHEAFDNCCPPPAKITWNAEQIKAPLFAVAKEFAPKIKNTNLSSYGNGSCVPYARYKTGIQLTGWAGTLLERAEKAGYIVSDIPAQGGMVITSESNGHVAVVEKIEADTIIISEQNWKGPHIVSSRMLSIDSPIICGYIYRPLDDQL